MKKLFKNLNLPGLKKKPKSTAEIEGLKLFINKQRSTPKRQSKDLIGVHNTCIVVRKLVAEQMGVDGTTYGQLAVYNGKLSFVYKHGPDATLLCGREEPLNGNVYFNLPDRDREKFKQWHGQYKPGEIIEEGDYYITNLHQVK